MFTYGSVRGAPGNGRPYRDIPSGRRGVFSFTGSLVMIQSTLWISSDSNGPNQTESRDGALT
jgi:hypothetical protein